MVEDGFKVMTSPDKEIVSDTEIRQPAVARVVEPELVAIIRGSCVSGLSCGTGCGPAHSPCALAVKETLFKYLCEGVCDREIVYVLHVAWSL